MCVCIGCSSNTAVTQTAVTQRGSSSVVNELSGLDKVSYTTYSDYVNKAADNAGEASSQSSYSPVASTEDSSTGVSSAQPYPLNTAPSTHYTSSRGLDDMLLVYYGNSKRLKWGKNEVEKVVMHKYEDGHREWFFPSFLYLEFKNDEGYKFGDNQPGEKGAATQKHWQWLLNRYFSTAYNAGNFEGLKALDECIEDCKKILGQPPFKHHVVLSVPSPCTDFTEWGSININGKAMRLDFRNRNHRLEAVKWFINELITRFQAQHYKNIVLDGVYWVEETSSMTSWRKDKKTGEWTNMTGEKYDFIYENKVRKSNDILADVSKYVHTRGLKFYWIPFNGAYGNAKWKEFGFDRCDIQTGYFWGTPDIIRKENKLKTMADARKICDRAINEGMGVEFEVSVDLLVPCYGRAKKQTDIERPFEVMRVKDCKSSLAQMKAMGYKQYTYNPSLLQRLKNLITVFEEKQIFKQSNITYYFSNSEILKLIDSKEKKITRIIDQLARLIAQRHKK